MPGRPASVGGRASTCLATCTTRAGRLGFLNPTLYVIGASIAGFSAFHDVTSGNNVWDGDGNIPGYSAGPGWDPTTGLGSPNVASLINLLSQGRG